MELPQLSATPKSYPDCCLSISTKLLATLRHLLPEKTPSILSIGCGTGLLEALLQQLYPDARVEGVEVHSASNLHQYLNEVHIVSGTWDVFQNFGQADAMIFVYPREPKLVGQYLSRLDGSRLKTVVWLGPIVDWLDYEQLFRVCENVSAQLSISKGAESGVADYEMMVTLKFM